jgi:hypoxia-inducible factor (prolyl hydroxylase)
MALEEMCDNLIRDLNEYGVCVIDNFVGEMKGMRILEEAKCMYSAGLFRVSFIHSISFVNL